MKVKDFIKELEQVDPEIEVLVGQTPPFKKAMVEFIRTHDGTKMSKPLAVIISEGR